MNTEEKIADFLARAETRPPLSKLDPYHQLIRGLRQRRWTYQEIAVTLCKEFGVRVAASTIHAFMKVRANRRVSPLVQAVGSEIKLPATKPKRRFQLDA